MPQPEGNPLDPGFNRRFYLPRLPLEFYLGAAVVHWVLPIANKMQGWLNREFHSHFRELTLHACARENMVCPTYCLMPDHIHLLWMSLKLNSNQRNGTTFLRTYLEKQLAPAKFQHQPFDHVLEPEERRRNAFAGTCAYILNNPVRRNLAATPAAWEYSGAIIPGYPQLHPLADGFWSKFWKIYSARRDPACDTLRLPKRATS